MATCRLYFSSEKNHAFKNSLSVVLFSCILSGLQYSIMNALEQVQSILKSNKTPYKQIPLSQVPEKVLLEFLLYIRTDTPENVKKPFMQNMFEYGFIDHLGGVKNKVKKISNASGSSKQYGSVQKSFSNIPRSSHYSASGMYRSGGCSSCSGAV